jgi:transposase InsO family protein
MDTLVPKNHAEEVALFRSQIIGELSRRELEHGELAVELLELSKQRYRPPGSPHSRTFGVSTLERWLYNYKLGGLAALCPKPRSDRGHAQALSPELQQMLCDIRIEHPCVSTSLIRDTLVADGRLAPEAVHCSTLNRFFAEKGLDRTALKKRPHTRTRLRWQSERPNALWHADVCHGPTLQVGDRSIPVRVHALMDDHSRFILGLCAVSTERETDMLTLLVSAVRRHGVPDALYLDNGSTYRGQALRTACERLGITLIHAKPYDAPARGKMERFWGTLRRGCLDLLGQVASLHEVNVRLLSFVDQRYHHAAHGGLLGKTPKRVYEAADPRPPDSLTEQKLREAFTVRERRRVNGDSTLSIGGTLYELDRPFFAGRTVSIVRCLLPNGGPPAVEHEGTALQLHPVDPTKNATRHRQPLPAPTPKDSQLRFDPAGTLLDQAVRRRLPCQEVKK